MINNFKIYLETGVVKKQSPSFSRANYLVMETEKSMAFLKKLIAEFGVTDENANSITKLCHDCVLELVRAKMLKDGFNAVGAGAHEAEVAYMRELRFSEIDVQFADQLRFFRNGILYYGKILDKEYADKVVEFTNRLYPALLRIVK